MSIRFQADNDIPSSIVRGVKRREPAIDFRTAGHAELDGVPDPELLARAAREDRIVVTCDQDTMPAHFYDLIKSGVESPGIVLIVPQRAPIGAVVESILLIWGASHEGEFRNRIVKVPF